MDSEIGEVCNEIVKRISEDGVGAAQQYCREHLETEVDPGTERYSEIKSEAINETEVWGNESEMWMKLVPAAASEQETESEWYFVVGNLLISSVMECETTGSLADDAVISKAANEMFKNLHKSERHQKLSIALYHHKTGHILASHEEEYESSIEHFETAEEIIEEHESLGNWHHHALVKRDMTKTKIEYYKKQDDLLKAVELANENADEIKEMNSPTSDKFYKHIKAKEHAIRAKIAAELDKVNRQRKHLRKCSKLYSETGKEDLAEKYGRKEMQVRE